MKKWLVAITVFYVSVIALYAVDYRVDILLADGRVYLVEAATAQALQSERQLVREWRPITPKFLEDIAAIVRARRTETNPKAGLRTYTGTWRIVRVDTFVSDKFGGHVVETLRFGLATTLADDEARLGESLGDPQVGGFRFRQYWPYVDPQYADTLTTTLNATVTVTDPQADAQTYTGTFAASQVGNRRNEDGSIEIFRWLSQVTTVANVAELAAAGYRITEDNKILRLFGLETGEGDVRACIWDNLDSSGATFATCMSTITDAQLVSNFATGWTYADRHWKDNKDNTSTFIAGFQKEAWTNVTGTTPNQVIGDTNIFAYINYDPQNTTEGLDFQQVSGADGIPTTEIEEVRDNTQPDTDFALDRITINDNRDGSSGLRLFQTKTRATDDDFYVAWTAANGGRAEREEAYWKNLTAANATLIHDDAKTHSADMTGSSYSAAPASHILLRVRRIPRDNGLFDVHRETWIPNNTGTAIWPPTGTYSTTIYAYKYRRAKIDGIATDQKRKITMTKTVKYHATADTAWNELVGAVNLAPGSDVKYIGHLKWMSIKIVHTDLGTWVDDAATP